MSAVLPVSPCNPTVSLNFKDLLKDPEFKDALKGLMITFVKEDKEFRESIMGVMEEFVIESNFKIVKRLAALETTTGLDDYSDLEDEEGHELTIPRKYRSSRRG